MKYKHIAIAPETYEALRDLGSMKDTFNTVINRLIKDAQKWRIVREEFIKKLPTMYTKDRMEFIRKIEKLFKELGLMQEIST